MDDFEELRRLLLSTEQDDLRALHGRLDDPERRAREVSSVLPQAAKLSSARNGELSRALQPVVGDSVRESIKSKPQFFIEAFHPIIGPIVRRSIAESLRGLMQSLNRSLEHTFSWQGLKWRLEAWRTGRSFAEVVLLRSLVYRVEQIFLIHRETSLLLLHVSADAKGGDDSDMIASMLSAIQDFTRDSFQVTGALENFRIGELEVWIRPGRDAYLAATIRGEAPVELRTALDETLESAHTLHGSALAAFTGDAAAFEPLRPELEACLHAQYKQTDAATARTTKAYLAVGAAVAMLVAAGLVFLRAERRWNDFLHHLSAEPGIALTNTRRGWFSASQVAGLRDPLAADPGPLARKAGIDPQRIRFDWKQYLALDATSLRRRFEQRFGVPAGAAVAVAGRALEVSGSAPYEWLETVRQGWPQIPGIDSLSERAVQVTFNPELVLARFRTAFPPPPEVTARVDGETLHLSGKAAYEWIAPVREGATRLPGIAALDDREVKVAFDPALVLQRFESRFGLPDSVNAGVADGVLTVAGEASHAWLTRVRKGATTVPGITTLNESQLVDLDQTAFTQSKSVIENAFIYFLVAKVNFATEGFAALSRLPDEIRRCQTAAKRLGGDINVEIRGSTDAVGNAAKNLELSTGRANAVQDFLVSCGLEAAMFKTVPLPVRADPAGAAKPVHEEADRRVSFHIQLQQ